MCVRVMELLSSAKLVRCNKHAAVNFLKWRGKNSKHLQLEPLGKIKLEHELRLQILAAFQDVFCCLIKSKFIQLAKGKVMLLISRGFLITVLLSLTPTLKEGWEAKARI